MCIRDSVRDLPSFLGIKVSPSGCLPSGLVRPTGSFITGVPEVEMARATTIINPDTSLNLTVYSLHILRWRVLF